MHIITKDRGWDVGGVIARWRIYMEKEGILNGSFVIQNGFATFQSLLTGLIMIGMFKGLPKYGAKYLTNHMKRYFSVST